MHNCKFEFDFNNESVSSCPSRDDEFVGPYFGQRERGQVERTRGISGLFQSALLQLDSHVDSALGPTNTRADHGVD